LLTRDSPVLLTQSYLAHALPGYMTVHPNVSIFVEPTDVNVIEERLDIAIPSRAPLLSR